MLPCKLGQASLRNRYFRKIRWNTSQHGLKSILYEMISLHKICRCVWLSDVASYLQHSLCFALRCCGNGPVLRVLS